MLRTLLVVPCYNEADRLDRAQFRSFLQRNASVDFIFVNDGSKDHTRDVLLEFQRENSERVQLLDKPINGGKAAAVRDGLLKALQSNRDAVGFWDADLATPLEAIDDFIHVLEVRPEIAMVFGARVQLLGRDIQRRAIRHYLGRIFATCASTVLQLPIYDTQCGAKIFRATPQLASALKDPFVSRWIFDVELIARFIQQSSEKSAVQQSIYEFPLHRWIDIAGSKVRPGDFFRAFFELLEIRSRYLSSRRHSGK